MKSPLYSADLTGRVVAITGGARGIGAATARAFAAAGAIVAIGDIDESLAGRNADQIGGVGFFLDVTDDAGVAAFLDAVERRLGPVDVMVNNAGIMPVVPVLEETGDSVRRQLAVNVAGVISGTRHAAARMSSRGSGGHVVNIASAAGRMGFPGVATYSGSKFAVMGFTEATSLELADTGIRFTCVLPGVVDTELTSGLRDHWLLRSCQPDDVAAAVVRAVRRGTRTVYVPRRLGPLAWAYGLLPAAARIRLMAALGAGHQMLDADAHARSGYQKRIESPQA
ncbi:MAG: SDR family oxidoreductase [Actinomycetota bacterium]